MADYVEQTRKLLRTAGRSPKTANSYLSHIRRLQNTYGSESGDLDEDALREYLEGLVDEGKSLSYINQAQSAIRFMYKHVLGKDNPLPSPGLISKKVPLHGIFTRDEIRSIFANVHELKYRLALMLIYSSGLRVGEATHLLRNAADFDKMVIHVNDQDGKHQDRNQERENASQTAAHRAEDHHHDLQSNQRYDFDNGQYQAVLGVPLDLAVVLLHQQRNQGQEPQI